MDSAYLSQLTSIDVTEDNLTNLTVPCNIKRRASMCDPIVLTEIAKDLYPLNSTSNNGSPLSNSPYSEVGLIEFRIQYFAESKKLVVELLRIFDLKLNETTSIRELYCKCKLIPDTFSFETKFLKASHEILVEEKFEFSYLEFTDLDTYLLEVALCVYCPDSRDEILGLCQVRLNYSNIETIQVLIKDLKSTHKKHDESYHGELLLTIAYLPGAERLTINVRKARNLDMIGLEKKEILPDPYVKVSVCDKDNNRLKKKKTATEKATTNPTFNQEVVFTNLKKEQLEKMVIRFSVYNDSIKNRECLGEVEFHSQSRGQRYAQWKNMIDGKKSSAWWHNLTVSDHSENEKSRFHNFINRSKSPSLRKDSIIDNFLF